MRPAPVVSPHLSRVAEWYEIPAGTVNRARLSKGFGYPVVWSFVSNLRVSKVQGLRFRVMGESGREVLFDFVPELPGARLDFAPELSGAPGDEGEVPLTKTGAGTLFIFAGDSASR